MPVSTAKTEVYYRWTDADGRVHLVSSLEDVPASVRPRAERLELRAGAETSATTQSVAEQARAVATSSTGTLVLVGAGVGLALLLLSRAMPSSLRWLAKVGAFALVAAVLGGLYLGVLRRSAGLGDNVLATPSAIIGDAQSAVEKMNQRQKQQEEELRRIQSEAH